MTALSLLALPITIASTIIQAKQQEEANDQQRAAADRQQATDQQRQAIAQQQVQLDSTAQQRALLAQQNKAIAALQNYYYKSGIDPTSGSAQNALLALSQKNTTDLEQLARATALRKQEAGLIGANDFGGNAVQPYNPFPATVDLLNTIGRGVANLSDLSKNNNNNNNDNHRL
ncbi:MAG: hypothetical protein QM529_07170 [Hydrotalea sp.]|nr:hypothetical protein [Hydrotalea sp.]